MLQSILSILLCACLAQSTLPPEQAGTDIKKFDSSMPNVIYAWKSDRPERANPKPGDPCNFYHRDIEGLNKIAEDNNGVIPYDKFDLPCSGGSDCEFVFDRNAMAIKLSNEEFIVNGYKFTGKKGANIGTTVKTPIYFKKCICPSDKVYKHTDRTCGAASSVNHATGFYCEADATIIHPTIVVFILVFFVTLANIYHG